MNRLNFTDTDTMVRTWAKALRAGMMAAVAVCAGAADYWQVDPAGAWDDPMASHHYLHAAGGAVLGFAAFEAAAIATDSRPLRYTAAIATGVVVGFGYEVYHRSDTTLADPVDACYAVAGSIIGAGLADLTNNAVSLALARNSVAVTYACRW